MDTWMFVLAALTALAGGAFFLWTPLRRLQYRGKNYICYKARLERVERLGYCGMCGVYRYVDSQGQQREYRDLHGAVLNGSGGAALAAPPDVRLYVARNTGRVTQQKQWDGPAIFMLVAGLGCVAFGLALLIYALL